MHIQINSELGKIEITLHFYNHNKPKDKKQSKMLVQGSVQSAICDFVFGELPNIYKMVCSRKLTLQTPVRQSKRRRLSTSIKKRNIRYKTAPKVEQIECAPLQLMIYKYIRRTHTEEINLLRMKLFSSIPASYVISRPMTTII